MTIDQGETAVDTWGEVLEFWMGPLDDDGLAAAEQRQRWFQKSDDFDREIERRFGERYRAIVAGEHEDWLESPRGRLAYIIVLDQFSRNMFRDSAEMYAADERSLAAALGGIDQGDDDKLRTHERMFLYMPLMHAEDLAHQRRCEELFQHAAAAHEGEPAKAFANNAGYAERHRVIVERFGRFPHRNAIVGRESTPEEVTFLAEPGSSF